MEPALDTSMFVLARIGRLRHAATVTHLQSALQEIAWCMGFDHFLFGQQIGERAGEAPRQTVISGYPEAWRRRYVERNYVSVDPTVSHCMTSAVPLPWTEELKSGPAAQMWEDAARHGLRHGLSVSVHDTGGTVSMLSLARERSLSEGAMQASIHAGQAVLSMMHFVVVHAPSPEVLQLFRLLTPREQEVMHLAGMGMSSREIAKSLNLTARTVGYHIGLVLKKLKCKNRAAAIAKLSVLGVVPPPAS